MPRMSRCFSLRRHAIYLDAASIRHLRRHGCRLMMLLLFAEIFRFAYAYYMPLLALR